MPRKRTKPQPGHGGWRPGSGRKPGVRLRCGECQQALTAREWLLHFAACPARPKLEKEFEQTA